MTDTTIQSLFNEISTISSSYAKIRKANGENFNLFQILGMTSNEVKTHSRFIAELLNPKGSHDMGDVFLRLFIEQLNATETHFDTDNGETLTRHFHGFSSYKGESAIVEAYAGKVTETDGGRIDILVNCSEGRKIIIENKIYAGDQKLQMIRYDTYGRSTGKDYKLIYLTLDGKQPSDESKGALINDHHYACISYQDDIVEWLEKCRKEAVIHTPLRESITQYINLIGYLTGRTSNKDMQESIKSAIIANGNNFKAAELISQSIAASKLHILNLFAENLKSAVEVQRPGIIIQIDPHFGLKHHGMTFSYDPSLRQHLQFSFLGDFKEIYLEIRNIDNEKNGQINKNQENVLFFSQHLKLDLGKIENTEKNWWGDWVCRYSKLDIALLSENGYEAMCNHNFQLAEETAIDLIPILDSLLARFPV